MWFGLSDLHNENVLVGKQNGKLCIAPIDIECAAEKLILPSQTMLIAYNQNYRSSSGLDALVKDKTTLDIVGPVCVGYLNALRLLEINKQHINDIIAQINMTEPLICRLVLKNTKTYLDHIHSRNQDSTDSKFHPAEIEQMTRGDVPYFFRRAASNAVYYFTENKVEKEINGEEISPGLDERIRKIDQSGLRIEENEIIGWLKAGPLQIARRLLHQEGMSPYRLKYSALARIHERILKA